MLGARVIVRHNLTVMFEPGQEDLPEFFREQEVEVVSSLPYFLGQQTDAQRGPRRLREINRGFAAI